MNRRRRERCRWLPPDPSAIAAIVAYALRTRRCVVDEWVCSARTVPSVSARWALAGGSSTESLADSTSERRSHAGRRRGLRRSGSARHLGLPAAHRDRPDGHASNASGASRHEALPEAAARGPVQTERPRRRPSKPVSPLRSVRSSATSRFAPSLRPSTSHDALARARRWRKRQREFSRRGGRRRCHRTKAPAAVGTYLISLLCCPLTSVMVAGYWFVGIASSHF